MPKVTMWMADDGTLFESESEYNLYQEMIAAGKEVEVYMKAQKWANTAQETKARNTILDFLKWQATPSPATEDQEAA